MATTLELSYFNTFWLKRLKNFTQYQERQPDGTVDVEAGGITTGTPDPTTGDGYINSNVYKKFSDIYTTILTVEKLPFFFLPRFQHQPHYSWIEF